MHRDQVKATDCQIITVQPPQLFVEQLGPHVMSTHVCVWCGPVFWARPLCAGKLWSVLSQMIL